MSFWTSLVALALIGIGAHEALRGPWTLLVVPGSALACLACLRATLRGPRDRLFESMRWARPSSGTGPSKPRSLAVTRMWLAFLAVMLAVGAGLAVAAPLPPRPSVDVQVVPVAYEGDPHQGTQPKLFGLGVRLANCSGGATAYTLAVHGARLELTCAATSGTRTRAVIVGLRPGRSYAVTIRAVQKPGVWGARAGKILKLNVEIPVADSKTWHAST